MAVEAAVTAAGCTPRRVPQEVQYQKRCSAKAAPQAVHAGSKTMAEIKRHGAGGDYGTIIVRRNDAVVRRGGGSDRARGAGCGGCGNGTAAV